MSILLEQKMAVPYYKTLVLIAVASTVASGIATAKACVLPVADGGGVEPSAASLIAKIIRAEPGQVMIKVDGNSKPVRIVVAPDTELFTVYGGGIDAEDLAPGQHVLVWFDDCVLPKHAEPRAVVLQVCSLAAEPCPT